MTMNSHVVRELVIPHVKIYSRTQSSRIDLKTYKNLVYTEAASQINESTDSLGTK